MLSTIFLFIGLGAGEITLILFIVVLMFGAKKIPELARGMGKGLREFKEASAEVSNEIHQSINKER